MKRRAGFVVSRLLAAALALAGCQALAPAERDADVIVIGAGIGGLAAAMEAESLGARVLVIDANSVAGGHAVRAAGFSLVDTPLQQARGHRDSPDIAWRDMMDWGEDADPWWVRFYVENARTQVHDWLASLGVRFAILLHTPEDSVPRFHMPPGAAVNAVLPMMREAFSRERIEFRFSTEAMELLAGQGRITGVRTVQSRTGEKRVLRAPAVIITTGGYQNNLHLVRAHWNASVPRPARLLMGAGEFARGSGMALAERAGAATTRLDHQVIFTSGLPDPRDPLGAHGLLAQNPAAIWVDATGRRFIDEAAPSKVTNRAVLDLSPATHWLIFDAAGLRQLTIRGAAWLSPKTLEQEILQNPAAVKKGDTIRELADAAGLPADRLEDTVQRFNGFVDRGEDTDFGRPGPGATGATIRTPPYYAIQLFPMTRQSMGGIRVDHDTRVLASKDGRPLRGLYAAGEVTGVAGINGSFGGSGGFLGPSLLMGRVAGRNAAALALDDVASRKESSPTTMEPTRIAAGHDDASPRALGSSRELAALLGQQRPGFWHFRVSHTLVLEREERCETCHRDSWPPGPANERAQRLMQLESCTRCH